MTDLRELKFEKQSSPEGSECTCASALEHEALVRSINESFRRDTERAKMRTERNTHNLRMNVLRQLNGHSRD
jgi:hypothetical protein